MNKSALSPIAFACMLLLAACQQNIEDIGGRAKPSTQAATTSTTTAAATQAVYDPLKDPLVNPKEMFEPAPADAAAISNDETLVMQLEGSPTNLNPLFQSAGVDMYAIDPIFMLLFTADAKLNWVVNKDFVESCTESPDHLVYTVKLRPGLTWHDGQPLTARDVRFSWEAIMDDRVPCPAVKTGPDMLNDVEVVDDLTVKFICKEALATNVWNINFPIVPKHIFDNPAERKAHPNMVDGPYYNKYNRETIVGSGPYKLVEWIANDRLVYERWDGYKGTKPHFKRIIMKIQPDPQTSLLLFKKGDLDYIDRLTSQQFAKETNDAAFAAHGRKAYGPEWSYAYIGWNMDGSNPFFNDVRVRRAMTQALDVDRVIRELGYNLPQPCLGIFHPGSWMFDPTIKRIPFDLKASAQLLEEAGWKVNPADGWRYKTVNNHQVKFEFELLIPQGSPIGPDLAAIYANDLRQVGVSLKTRIVEWTVFQQMNQNHECQAWTAAWGSGADPDGAWNVWHSSQYDGGRNYGGYKNARVDALLDQGRREFDKAKRAAVYQEIDHIIYDEQPYTFIYYRPTLTAVHKRLRGIELSPVGLYLFYPGWTNWWTPTAQSLRK
ncbi:MAG: ABC transporter substrate-binding protein [Candidatus Sumerlaeia bacterium]